MRRVRALIAKGHAVADQASFVLQLVEALIADLQDGFGVELSVEVDKEATRMLLELLAGKPGTLPIKLITKIDPTIDAMPSRVARFVGGQYDGKEYIVDESKTELVLVGGDRYVWDGHVFQHQA